MQIIGSFLSCMENVGSNMVPIPSSKLRNWRSVFIQCDEYHGKRSCLPLFFKHVKV